MTDLTEAGVLTETDVDRSAGTRTIVRGGSWSLLPQVVAVAVNLGLSPYVLHGLGVARYGLFFFVSTAAQFLGTFDGGITTSAQRFFAQLAGARDAIGTTRLLTTLVAVTTLLGVVLFDVMWFASPAVVAHLHMAASLRPEGEFLLRATGVILGTALVRNAVTAILIAHQRFRFTAVVLTVLYGEYAAGLVLTVQNHWGLQGVAWTLICQQVLVTLVFVPRVLPYLDRRGIGLYGWTELRRFFAYSGKVQVTGLATLFLLEIDVLVIGAVLPIKEVAIYSLGANFAAQLRTVPLNALAPAMTTLGQTLGRDGRAELSAQFRSLQRRWVQAVSGWCLIGAAAAWFAVTAWYGPGFEASGVVAIIALGGNLFYLGTSLVTVLLGLTDRPGDEARFSLVMVVVNVALTAALVLTGPIGVAAATSAGQLAGAWWLARRVRRTLPEAAGTTLRSVPVLPSVVSALVVVGLELAIRPVVPHGAAGVLVSALPAVVGLVVFGRWVLGADAFAALMRSGTGRVRGRLA